MSRITIIDLEVFFSVGVTDEERAKPQRLLLSIDMVFDFTAAATSDRLEKTIDYYELSQQMLKYGEDRSWKLIEKLATDVADTVLLEFKPEQVTVEVKKFSIPQARYVSASLTKTRPGTKRTTWGIR